MPAIRSVSLRAPVGVNCSERENDSNIALFLSRRCAYFKQRRMSAKPKAAIPELNFEAAMDRLEAIVEQMESGKLPLEDLIVRYEEGMNLVKVCQERLASAEQKIEIIARNSAGKPLVKNFEPAAEMPGENKTAERETNKNDDVSLF